MYRSVRKLSGHVLSAHSGKTLLPGFGRPLNYAPEKEDLDFVGDLFPNALSGWHMRNGATTYACFIQLEIHVLDRFLQASFDNTSRAYHAPIDE